MRYRILCAVLVLTTGCGSHREPAHAADTPLAVLQAKYGTLITTGNHPTPDQHGTGDRIGFFRNPDGTVWGVPLSIAHDGGLVGCAPAALQNAPVTDKYPSDAAIIGTTNEPTGWRGGTGKLELVLRETSGDVSILAVKGGKLSNGPVCWAQVPPGPSQQLLYYRLAPGK